MRPTDLASVFGFLENARSVEGPAPFTRGLVDDLVAIVDCEYGRYEELDVARRVDIAHLTCSTEAKAFPNDPDEMTSDDWDQLPTNPCYRASLSAKDGIFVHSEVIARCPIDAVEAAWWDEAFEGGLVIDRMWIGITAPTWAGFAFDACERGFGERDLDLACALKPHLTELWRNAAGRRRLRAALAALDHDETDGVILVGTAGAIEFASAHAQRLLHDHFGSVSARMPESILDWYEGGCRGALVLPAQEQTLVVEAAGDGSALLLREEPAGMGVLTPREHEVLRCVADGLSNSEIGRRLWISTTTVRKHLEHVYGKLGVSSRTAALAKLRVVPQERKADAGG
jgi:DNA-binding CsgD family transcriptional regulator